MVIRVRAFGGSSARKVRAVLPDRALKGEKLVATEVMYLVNMVPVRFAREQLDCRNRRW